jgi:alkylation response protein AidB-like acyl-CoA dehydrogenase
VTDGERGLSTGALAVIAAGAEEADRTGLFSAVSFEALRSTGLLEAKLPTELGGPGSCLLELFDLLEAVAQFDGSAAWNGSTMGTSAAWPASHLPDEGVDEVLDGRSQWPLFAGTFVTSGQARPERGGFHVSGRWGFASGIRHAEWLVAGCLRTDDRSAVYCVLPVHEVTIHDTWDTIGLRATGSCDYTVDDVFVPCQRTFCDLGPPARRGGHLNQLPILAFLTPDHTAITLGNARRALDCVLAEAREKQRLGSASALANRGAFQRDIGRADTALRAARSLVREKLSTLDACDTVTAATVIDARTVATYAAD